MTTDPSTVTLVGSLPPGTQLHEYRIERVLGHGGFGITYLARDTHLDKKVAIKEYLPNDLAARASDQTVTVRSPESTDAFKWGLDSFIKEARVLGKFSHPSLIQVHRYFEANRTAYFVMEYAEGVTLTSMLKHEGNLPEERLRKILSPILNGLEEVHRAGVLHRDIKPDNIILREGAVPVLIDFGAARQTLSSMTRSVMGVLTAGYAPIEQYASTGNQGPWTDLYAIGAVAYRAVSGKKPIDAVNRIRDDPMVPATTLGQGRYEPHFLAAIDWALSVNPEDRPRSVAEFKSALDGVTEPPDLTAPPGKADPTPVARTPVRQVITPEDQTVVTRVAPAAAQDARARWQRAAAIGAAMLVVAIIGVLIVTRPRPPELVTKPPEAAAVKPEPPAAAQPEAKSETKPEAKPATRPAPSPPASKEAPAGAAPVPKPAAPKPAPAQKAPATTLVPVASMPPLSSFQDCPKCPPMVALAAGTYQMGATPKDMANKWEEPAHAVTLSRPFAIGRNEVTVAEWQACVLAKACTAAKAGPLSAEGGKAPVAPVVHINWADAQAYVAWLTKTTGRRYRLPTESEWEYAIRARTGGARYWGGDRTLQCRFGNGADLAALKRDPKLPAAECNDGFAALAPVGSFEPNAFGLYDMAGNAWEWTQDCWHDSHRGSPANGSAYDAAGCDQRVIRGGSWRARANSLRSFGRGNSPADVRSEDLGLRVAAE
jgi:formylglycine-generating enzyme required for sulfatase activity